MTSPVWVTPSGRIAEVLEGDTLLTSFEFTSDVTATVEIISGEIPDGTVINQISNTSYQVTGTVAAIPTEKEYFFTVRVTNVDGQIERGFGILVSQVAPLWLTNTRLATIVELDTVEHQFQLADPGGISTFTKIAGTLPPGVSINATGLLKGRVGEIDVDTLYSFTMRAESSEGTTIDKDFEILVQNATGNRSPIWLTSSGIAGLINNGETSSIVLNAFDPDGDALTFTLTAGSLPDGLTLNTSTGAIEGVCSTVVQGSWPFTVLVSDGSNIRIRNFSITTNENFDASITWVTEAGNIGTLKVGENSLLSLDADSNYPIRFSISLGSLPQGLQLHPSEATIYDDVQFQSSGTYTFTVLAENDFVQASRQFNIEIEAGYEERAIRAYFQIPYQFIDEYREIIEGETIDREKLFRPYDERFGVQEFPRILVQENLKTAGPAEFKSRYEKLMIPMEIIVGDLKLAYARDTDGFVLYEVLYREIVELVTDPLTSFVTPQTQKTIYPSSLNTFRDLFTNTFPGISGGTDTLPLWMTSEQIQNDSTSVLDFLPAITIVFMQPGEGEQLYADLLADEVFGSNVKGERIKFTSINFETSVDDDLPQDFSVHFHSLLETQEDQEELASNAPIWMTLPGLLDSFDDTDVVSIAVQANDPNDLPRDYSLSSGTLPTGLLLASNGIIAGVIDTDEEKYWSFIISANSSSGFSRSRSFIIGTNIDS